MALNQIIANFFLLVIEAVLIFFAITTKELWAIIASIVLGILTILFILQSIKVIKKDKGLKVKHDLNYTAFIVLIIATVFFVVCMSSLVKNINYRNNGIQTNATIYQIDKDISYKTKYDSSGNPYQDKEETCEVYIKYTVDGIQYKNKLDISSCGYSKGDIVKIYYQKDNPNEFISGTSSILVVIGTIISGSVFILVIYRLITEGSRKKKK